MKHLGVHLLRVPIVRRVWAPASRLIARVGGYRLAARLTLLGTDWGAPGRDRPGVVCLMRDLFSKDVEELRRRGSLNYVCLLGGVSRLQAPFFPPEMQVQTTYQGHDGPGRERAERFARAYAAEVLRLVEGRQRVDAVLTANMDYWQDLGFKLVCRDLGIPFLVLMREHPTIPEAYNHGVEWYRDAAFRFEGTGIAVAGDQSVSMLADVPGLVDPDAVTVTGLPRLDAWRDVDVDVPATERNAITLLTFTDGYYADGTFVEVLATFVEAARAAGGSFKFVVKCKNYQDLHAVRSRLTGPAPGNLELVYDEPLYSLLPRSRLVIGFNSLSMAEAALARSPLCVPYYGECRRDGSQLMFDPGDPRHRASIAFPSSPRELAECIAHHCSDQVALLDAQRADAIVRQFFHIPDNGTISAAVERFITDHARRGRPAARDGSAR